MFVTLGERGIYLYTSPAYWSLHYWTFYDGNLVCTNKGISLSPQQVDEMKKNIDIGEQKVSIGDDVYLEKTEFKGHKLFHIRKFVADRPTKMGIALRADELDEFITHLQK